MIVETNDEYMHWKDRKGVCANCVWEKPIPIITNTLNITNRHELFEDYLILIRFFIG